MRSIQMLGRRRLSKSFRKRFQTNFVSTLKTLTKPDVNQFRLASKSNFSMWLPIDFSPAILKAQNKNPRILS